MDQDTSWYGGTPRPGRHSVRWGPTSPTERGTAAPAHFVAQCLLWPYGWINQLRHHWYGLGPGDIVLDVDPAPPPHKGAQQLPFRPTAVVRICAGPHLPLPITRILDRQCAAGGSRGNPTDNCHPSSLKTFLAHHVVPFRCSCRTGSVANALP